MALPPRSAVVTFLHNKNLWVTSKDASGIKLTHTFMDGRHGGKVCVTPTHVDAFYDAIATDVERGILPPLNELKVDEVFNYFIDFDIRCKNSASLPDMSWLASVVMTTVAKFVIGFDVHGIVLAAPDKKLDDSGSVKRGVHMHFPDLRVTMQEALLMREAIIDALKRHEGVDWAEDFDNAPYVNPVGGLRTVGASKACECKFCNNKLPARKTCAQCEHRGKVEADPPQRYALVACHSADGSVHEENTKFLRLNVAALVRKTSIRAFDQRITPQWKRYPGCPSYSEVKFNARKPPSAGTRKRAFSDDKTSMRSWPTVQVTQQEQIKRLELIFRTRFASEEDGSNVYANVDLYPIRFSTRHNTFYCQFTGSGESFCHNVGRDHNSNRVYGIVTRTTAMIKCHSNKKECKMANGCMSRQCCKDFVFEKRLSPKDIGILFAEQQPSGAGKRAKAVDCGSCLSRDDMLQYMSDKLF